MSKETQKRFEDYVVKALKLTGNKERPDLQFKGAQMLAKALKLPLRDAIFFGDIITDLYQREFFEYAQVIEYPLDPIAPGEEKYIAAYTIPGEGDLPTRHFEADFVTVPTYEVGQAISWHTKYARDARWNVFARFMQAMEASFIKKRNDDGWRTLIAAALDRNVIVFDSQAAVGSFTKRLISNMKLVFTRNGGGNSTSTGRRFLTDIFLSPEMVEDMRNWGLDEVDEITRREIYVSDDGSQRLSRIFGVNLHPLHEFGEEKEYQQYYTDQLGGGLASGGDVELMVGVNMDASNSFMHPIRDEVTIVADPRLNNFRKAGLMGIADWGFSCLDGRDVILGSA